RRRQRRERGAGDGEGHRDRHEGHVGKGRAVLKDEGGIECGLATGTFWKAVGVHQHTCGLIPLDQMPHVPPSMTVPQTLYWLLGCPAPFAGMRYPARSFQWGDLHGLGVQHVVCLEADTPGYDPRPIRLLYATALQDLVKGGPPRNPLTER